MNFMSAYDNFVFNVFEFLPFGYIQKDKLDAEISHVVARIVERLTESSGKVTLNTISGSVVTDLSKVLYFESDRNYYIAHLTDGKTYICRGTLSVLENQLALFDFYRIHSAYLVNLEHVYTVEENTYLILDNRIKLPIAQRRLSDFKNAFSSYTRRRCII